MSYIMNTMYRIEEGKRRDMMIVSTSSSDVDGSIIGMYDKRIDIHMMNITDRSSMIRHIFSDMSIDISSDMMHDIALRTSGFNLHDFIVLSKNVQCMKYKDIKHTDTHDDYTTIKKCLSVTKPINLSFTSSIPNVRWGDIGGYTHVKQLIHRIVELPLKNPDIFKRRGIKPSKVYY